MLYVKIGFSNKTNRRYYHLYADISWRFVTLSWNEYDIADLMGISRKELNSLDCNVYVLDLENGTFDTSIHIEKGGN